MWPTFKFWDAQISLEWLKVQTSNFACWLTVKDTKPRNEKWVKRGRGLGHVTYISKFGTPLISPEWLKIQTSNFAWGLKVRDTNKKMKNGSKGKWTRSRDLLFKFWEPPNISGTAEDTNLKCCMPTESKGHKTEKWKMVKRRRGPGHVTYFSNFLTPPISAEWLKLQTSNFACGLIYGILKQKIKTCQKGAWPRSRDRHFKFFDSPYNLCNGWRYKPQNLHAKWPLAILHKKMKEARWGCGVGHVTYF